MPSTNTIHPRYTLSQFLFDHGYRSSAIDGECIRLRLVIRGLRPLTILSPLTLGWARERGIV